ncbi:MAG: aminoglycoside phosphotransferase family protein [Clostridiales bacterium]|nr:aminoglycoside phosphotransferase family protein [Clostridiales bacterium]
MSDKEILEGGRMGKIIREGDKIIRPANEWTEEVHKFLSFLKENGLENIPTPLGIADGVETVSFVEGTVCNDGLTDELRTDEVLVEVAKLLRKFHDLSEQYVKTLTGKETWMLQKQLPVQILCHGDFAPYNITFVDGHPSGIIDFDTVHPGPRVWDIAYAVYRWVPFVAPSNPDCKDNMNEQLRKMKLFADAYDMNAADRNQLGYMMISRLEALVKYMNEQAAKGNEDVKKNIEAGHLDIYKADIQFLGESQMKILKGIS